MKKRIIISVTSDLSTDQRVLKVAQSCFNNGYDVLLVGRLLKNSHPLYLPYSYKRLRLIFKKSALFYAEFNLRLFFLLLFSRANIFLSNDTDTLMANFVASKLKHKKLIFDAHELFPEVPELANRPIIKHFWCKLEDLIFPHLKNSYTVCQSIADFYNNKYSMNMKIVRNIPFYKHRKINAIKKNNAKNKIILYQGALNIGRGLEWIINAMPYIQNAKLVIIGDGDIKTTLEKQVLELNIEDKVKFIGKIPAEKLYEYTINADIGLCLLENKGLSYYYSLPNRIFDYIHAEVPVLATRFPEITNIVETYKTGVLINHYEPSYLATTINEMLFSPINTDHFSKLSKILSWENEEKILLEILSKA